MGGKALWPGVFPCSGQRLGLATAGWQRSAAWLRLQATEAGQGLPAPGHHAEVIGDSSAGKSHT